MISFFLAILIRIGSISIIKYDGVLLRCFFIVFIFAFPCRHIFAIQYEIASDINVKYETNDNIYLSESSSQSANGTIITPKINIDASEKDWSFRLSAFVRDNDYSDSRSDSLNKNLSLTSSLLSERDTYSLSATYNLNTSLDPSSLDFGIALTNIDRETITFAPSYSRTLSERLSLSFNYSHKDVDYLNSVNPLFTAYINDSLSGSLSYKISEINTITTTLQASDYLSENNDVEYQLYVVRLGINHKFSNDLSSNMSFGGSWRDVTNTSVQSFDFLGQQLRKHRS